MQCNNLKEIPAEGTDQLKTTYASRYQSLPAIKKFLLSAFLGTPPADLCLNFHVSKQSQKQRFATVSRLNHLVTEKLAENKITESFRLEGSSGGHLVQLQSWTRLLRLLSRPGVISPRLEIPQPPWAFCSSVWSVRANKLVRIQMQTGSSTFQIQLCCQRDQSLAILTDFKKPSTSP